MTGTCTENVEAAQSATTSADVTWISLGVKTIKNNMVVSRYFSVPSTATIADAKAKIEGLYGEISALLLRSGKDLLTDIAQVSSPSGQQTLPRLCDVGIGRVCEICCLGVSSSSMDIRRLGLAEFKDIVNLAIRFTSKKLVMSISEQLNDTGNLRYGKKEYDRVIQELTTKPLNRDQTHLLSTLSASYVIPKYNSKSKPYAFVCYNTWNREGAEEECQLMCDAFTQVGFVVKRFRWEHFHELTEWVTKQIKEVDDTCSALFCSLMSHGSKGHVLGNEGSRGEINELLQICENNLHPSTPLALIIQACQGVRNPVQDKTGETSNSKDVNCVNRGQRADKHTTLKRKHTALFMATVEGGVAVRGAYTAAMADQIKKADGITDVIQMHTRAVKAMENIPECASQVPEQRSTLKRMLIIPKRKIHYQSTKATPRPTTQPARSQASKSENMKTFLQLNRPSYETVMYYVGLLFTPQAATVIAIIIAWMSPTLSPVGILYIAATMIPSFSEKSYAA